MTTPTDDARASALERLKSAMKYNRASLVAIFGSIKNCETIHAALQPRGDTVAVPMYYLEEALSSIEKISMSINEAQRTNQSNWLTTAQLLCTDVLKDLQPYVNGDE